MHDVQFPYSCAINGFPFVNYNPIIQNIPKHFIIEANYDPLINNFLSGVWGPCFN